MPRTNNCVEGCHNAFNTVVQTMEWEKISESMSVSFLVVCSRDPNKAVVKEFSSYDIFYLITRLCILA